MPKIEVIDDQEVIDIAGEFRHRFREDVQGKGHQDHDGQITQGQKVFPDNVVLKIQQNRDQKKENVPGQEERLDGPLGHEEIDRVIDFQGDKIEMVEIWRVLRCLDDGNIFRIAKQGYDRDQRVKETKNIFRRAVVKKDGQRDKKIGSNLQKLSQDEQYGIIRRPREDMIEIEGESLQKSDDQKKTCQDTKDKRQDFLSLLGAFLQKGFLFHVSTRQVYPLRERQINRRGLL